MSLYISGAFTNHGTTRTILPTDASTPYSPEYSALPTSASSHSSGVVTTPADFTDMLTYTATTKSTVSTTSPAADKSKLVSGDRHETIHKSPSYSTNTLPIATDAASTFASDNAAYLQPAEHTKSYVRYGSTVSPTNVQTSSSVFGINRQAKVVVEPNGNLPSEETSTARYASITDDMMIGFNKTNRSKLHNETNPAKRRNDDGK